MVPNALVLGLVRFRNPCYEHPPREDSEPAESGFAGSQPFQTLNVLALFVSGHGVRHPRPSISTRLRENLAVSWLQNLAVSWRDNLVVSPVTVYIFHSPPSRGRLQVAVETQQPLLKIQYA
jgi:hypothetical protein